MQSGDLNTTKCRIFAFTCFGHSSFAGLSKDMWLVHCDEHPVGCSSLFEGRLKMELTWSRVTSIFILLGSSWFVPKHMFYLHGTLLKSCQHLYI